MTFMRSEEFAADAVRPEATRPGTDPQGWVISKWSRLGVAVRDQRREHGMTQAELARLAGVSRGWLVRFESGLDNADAATVLRVLQVLDLDLVLRPHRSTDDEDLLSEVLGD
jgi:HTH-type transcriptional regulator / antitoxin HipB